MEVTFNLPEPSVKDLESWGQKWQDVEQKLKWLKNTLPIEQIWFYTHQKKAWVEPEKTWPSKCLSGARKSLRSWSCPKHILADLTMKPCIHFWFFFAWWTLGQFAKKWGTCRTCISTLRCPNWILKIQKNFKNFEKFFFAQIFIWYALECLKMSCDNFFLHVMVIQLFFWHSGSRWFSPEPVNKGQ